MEKKNTVFRWLPAFITMLIIFVFSSIPSKDMPDLGLWDIIIKKGGHILGYALLALAFWHGLYTGRRRYWLAFLLTIVYAISDEFHQSFVPGRHPSWVDAFIIDGSGAFVMLMLVYWFQNKSPRNPGRTPLT